MKPTYSQTPDFKHPWSFPYVLLGRRIFVAIRNWMQGKDWGLDLRPTLIIHPMRINLVTPFAEKDAVKALGARWDVANKNWYIIDVEDLTPFLRWIPNSGTDTENMAGVATPQAMKFKKAPAQQSKGTAVLKLGNEVPHCGCNVQPWEDCKHTEIK